MGCTGVIALVLGGSLAGLSEGHFGVIRLWTYGVCSCMGRWSDWRLPRSWLAAVHGWHHGGPGHTYGRDADRGRRISVESHWLEVSHWRIASPKIHKPVRIVVLADLQTDSIGPYQRRVLQQVVG